MSAKKQLTLQFNEESADRSVGTANQQAETHPATPIEAIVGNRRQKVRRIRPPVKAHGGKYYLARPIVPILLTAPGNPNEYLEPCAFGASVFLALPRFDKEILGDVNPDVILLWRVLSNPHLAARLQDRLAQIPYCQEAFNAASRGEAADKVEAAADFVVRSRFSRGGLGKSFAWSTRLRGGKPGDENAWDTYRQKSLPQIIERAQGVVVTNEPCWWSVWQSRHHPNRLIYADPPYVKETRTAKKAYGKFEMTRLQHFWLVAALRAHPGPAAVSGYRCADYDRWLHDWRRVDFEMPNNSGQKKRKQRRCESLWLNW